MINEQRRNPSLCNSATKLWSWIRRETFKEQITIRIFQFAHNFRFPGKMSSFYLRNHVWDKIHKQCHRFTINIFSTPTPIPPHTICMYTYNYIYIYNLIKNKVPSTSLTYSNSEVLHIFDCFSKIFFLIQ